MQQLQNKFKIHFNEKLNYTMQLANGQIIKPISETNDKTEIIVSGVSVKLNSIPMVEARGTYNLLFGQDCLKRVNTMADFAQGTYTVRANGKQAVVGGSSTQGNGFLAVGVALPHMNSALEHTEKTNDTKLSLGNHSNMWQKDRVHRLVNDHISLFAGSLHDLKHNTILKHYIHLKDNAVPLDILERRRWAKHELEWMQQELQHELDASIIKESNGELCSPVVFVKKKDGSFQHCAFNKVTKRESWPLLLIEDLLQKVAGYEYYACVDGYSGYFLAPVHKCCGFVKTPCLLIS